MLKILILNGSEIFNRKILSICNELKELEIELTFENQIKEIQKSKFYCPDIIIIYHSGEDKTLEHLKKTYYLHESIFVFALSDGTFQMDGVSLNDFPTLSCVFKTKRLTDILLIAKERTVFLAELEFKNRYIVILKASDHQIVYVRDIAYVKAWDNYCFIHLKNGTKQLHNKGLVTIKTELIACNFFQCHKSYLVNLNYLNRILMSNKLELTNGDFVPISRRRKQAIFEIINNKRLVNDQFNSKVNDQKLPLIAS